VYTSLTLHNIRHDSCLLLFFRLTANILEHRIHLFKGLPGSFRDAEESEDKGEETKDREEGVRACASVLD
jgi:hypothetical protein